MEAGMDFKEKPSPFPEMRVWQAIKQGHSFAIVLEERMGEEYESWSGYSLSWKRLPDGPVNEIVAPFFDSFDAAKKACEVLAEQVLKRKR